MTKDGAQIVPVWTLSTKSASHLPTGLGEEVMTSQRLTELRSALAAFVDSPVVTVEAHPLPQKLDRSKGIPLDSVSPLAQELARLVCTTAKTAPPVANAEAAGDVLYRMVVPAKVAAQVGKGLMKPMASKAAAGGVHSALVNSSGIAAQATFVPVAAEAAAAGAAGGAAGTAAAGVATAGALTVAAPLVLLAVAVGVSAYADHKRQQAIEHITELLERLHSDALERERSELDGCRDAIDKATAILLDQGKIGASLGLDSAVHAIGRAIELAGRRASKWAVAIDVLGDKPVEMRQLADSFPGLDGEGGEFRAHVEMAALAIALRRRVIVLQAVEHSQADPANPFENFVRSLKADQQRVDELESKIASVLLRLSTLEVRSPSRLLNTLMTRDQVDDLLESAYRLRELGAGIEPGAPASDVVIDIAKHADGTLLVLPAAAA